MATPYQWFCPTCGEIVHGPRCPKCRVELIWGPRRTPDPLFGVIPRGTPHPQLYAELQRRCENHPGGRDELIQTLLFLVGGIVSGNESLPDEVRHWARQAHDVILLAGKVR